MSDHMTIQPDSDPFDDFDYVNPNQVDFNNDPFTIPDELADAGEAFSDAPKPKPMTKLIAADLDQIFGDGGPLARELTNYEPRASQVEMAEAVKQALLAGKHALIEAPTGTGKSLAYLIPAILSGRTVVVATANKSLQSQLFNQDIPMVRRILGQKIDAVVVKGRSNFLCTYKWEKEAPVQDRLALYDRENDQVAYIKRWIDETETGDVDELPFMLAGDLRPRVVSYSDDCLQRDCPFYHDNCFVNFMRDKAAEAQVIVTNHHLLLNALKIGFAGERILPPADIYVLDEAHQLETTATAVFETTVTDYTVEQLLSRGLIKDHADEDQLDDLRFRNSLAFQSVANLSRDNAYRIEEDLEEIKELSAGLDRLTRQLRQRNPYEKINEDDEAQVAARRAYDLMLEAVGSAADSLAIVATSRNDGEMVRFAVRVFDRRRVTLEVHAAPINCAGLLSQHLFHPERDGEPKPRTVICTSATLATNGAFEHFKQRCGIVETGEEHVLAPVFDYAHQALLYQPALPAYNWKNAAAYYDDVAQEIERLLETSRGRALCLFTSWSGLQQVEGRLRRPDLPIIWPVRAQGDAPRDALLAWFKETPHSVLLATRSFWEGVDIPGEDLSLVVLDKMPFPTPKDPLHSARMKRIEESGRNSFGDYMAPLMTLALKQGFGRLIRRTSDRGVVAILDERLTSKAYGRRARADLPPARFSRHFGDVYRFYQAALESPAEFALNVWGDRSPADPLDVLLDDGEAGGDEIYWRWQLLRLQDGQADRNEGVMEGDGDPAGAELYAAVQGLRNLRARIERAGREPAHFSVEVRASQAGVERMARKHSTPLWREWQAERSAWRGVSLLACRGVE